MIIVLEIKKGDDEKMSSIDICEECEEEEEVEMYVDGRYLCEKCGETSLFEMEDANVL